jgi:hypothetical protein
MALIHFFLGSSRSATIRKLGRAPAVLGTSEDPIEPARGRRAMLRGSAALALCVVSACAGAPRPVGNAQVRFVLEPDTARVYTDERFLGAARVIAVRPIELRAGPRRFTITADGYFPHDLEVDLPPGLTTIRVSLRPVPP